MRKQLWDRHASPVSFLLLACLMIGAGLGWAGGQPNPRADSRFRAADLSVKTPKIIRNGEIFETQISITAKAPIDDATVAVEASLWRDTTINTMIPAATGEAYKNGSYRFSYGPVEAGETLTIKVDGQINPPLFAGNEGSIALYDGDRLLGRRQFRIRVLP